MIQNSQRSAKQKGSDRVFLSSQRMPPLVMVRAFEAVARTGSMRRAAEDIGVSHTVISRHVRNLELWAARKLLVTSPRGAKLTDDGEIFFQAVSKAFQMIAAAAAELKPTSRRKMLRIWSMPGLATRWIAPRLSMIEQTLKNAEIVLRATDRMPNFAQSEADMMIGFGQFNALPANAIPLLRPRMFPVASKKWLAENGEPKDLENLAGFPLIHEESRQQWTDWFEEAGMQLAQPLSGPMLWDANLGFDAALAGQGIALASRLTAGEEIERGNLIELLNTTVKLNGYYLLIRPDCAKDPLVGRFREWLETHIREYEEQL